MLTLDNTYSNYAYCEIFAVFTNSFYNNIFSVNGAIYRTPLEYLMSYEFAKYAINLLVILNFIISPDYNVAVLSIKP